MPGRLPNFLIIGAMKSGTSSLHEQLALRSGFFMSDPKEPCFFSDDEPFARGLEWYSALFDGARSGQRCGESSTHYTKLPTHPDTIARVRSVLPGARFVYLMRDPVERIVSQYIHEWTQREVSGSLDEAVRDHERYVDYSRYAYQLEPYLTSFGPDAVLPVFFERMVRHPDAELERVCEFLDDPSDEPRSWRRDLPAQNVSRERIRETPLRRTVRGFAPLRALKDRFPQSWRDRVKARWQIQERPELSAALREDVEARIDSDLARLGDWLGIALSCRGWMERVSAPAREWLDPPKPRAATQGVPACAPKRGGLAGASA